MSLSSSLKYIEQIALYRNVVRFLSLKRAIKLACGQIWGARPYLHYENTLIQPKMGRGEAMTISLL